MRIVLLRSITFSLIFMNAILWGEAPSCADNDLEDIIPPGIGLTEGMEEFLKCSGVSEATTPKHKINILIEALFDEQTGGFEYVPRLTIPPQLSFKERKGNCLTFAMLFISLARSSGLDANFNELEFTPRWEQEGDLVVECGHINVVVSDGEEQFVVEWLDSYKALASRYINPISDARAFSHYYGNLGLMAMTRDNPDHAYRCFSLARKIDHSNEIIWQNIGIYWLREGNREQAEQALLNATEVGKNASTAFFLLSEFYEKIGQSSQAEVYLKTARKYASKNPFYHYKRAAEAISKNDYISASKLLKKSIKIFPEYTKFHNEYASCCYHAGKVDSFEEGLFKAQKIAQQAIRIEANRRKYRQSQGRNEIAQFIIDGMR